VDTARGNNSKEVLYGHDAPKGIEDLANHVPKAGAPHIHRENQASEAAID